MYATLVVSTQSKNAEKISKSFIYLRRREEKVDSFFLSELVEVGFKSAFLGFLLTSDHRSYKQSFRNEALLFCKIQVKFDKKLSKQLVYKYRGKEK